MEISRLFKEQHIVFISKEDFYNKNLLQDFVNNSYNIIRLDGTFISNESLLIKSIYKQINAPTDFAINWNALWDTLTDREFFFTKPSVLIIENSSDLLLDENKREQEIFKEILMDLPQNELPFLVLYVD